MIRSASSLTELKESRAEWAPWLAVVEAALREVDRPGWSSALSPPWPIATPARDQAPREHAAPLLAGATLHVRARSVRQLLERLIDAAVACGTSKMTTLELALDGDLDVVALFKASLCQDADHLRRVAMSRSADIDAFQAVAGLLSIPVLHACGRRLESSIPTSWTKGYCPVCASWPAFVEERGIERSRHLRCSRCGAGWYSHGLCCVYCGLTDHEALVSLVPEKGRSHGSIEGCTRCLGYVKVLMKLQACEPAAVLLDDLSSVALDIAACSSGYVRPSGAGFSLDLAVSEPPARHLFGWNR